MAVWVGAAGGPAGDGEQVVGDGEFVVGLVVGEAVGEGGAGAVVAVGVWEDGESVACDDFFGFGDGVAAGGDADRIDDLRLLQSYPYRYCRKFCKCISYSPAPYRSALRFCYRSRVLWLR